MTETTVVAIREPQEPGDALTEVLRVGARQLLAEAIELEVGSSSPSTVRNATRLVASAWYATATCRSVRSKRALVACR